MAAIQRNFINASVVWSSQATNPLRPDDKQVQLEQLRAELKSPAEPVKIPANIELVTKNYDKLTAAMPQN